MFIPFPQRIIGAVALAAGLVLAGCSSESDVPPVVASTPDGGTKMNTDTGSGGTFPDVNTVPTQRPTSTIQDLVNLPEGLPGAPGGTQYGEPLVGGPSSSVDRPAPPPPPVEEVPPIPEPQGETQTQGSEVPSAPAPEPVAEVAPAEPPVTEEPVAEQPVADEPVDEVATAASEPITAAEPEQQASEPAPAAEVAAPAMTEPQEAETVTSDAIEPELESQQQIAEAVPAPEPPAEDYPVPQYGDVPVVPDSVAPAEAPQMAAVPQQPATETAALPASMQPPSVGAIWQQQPAPPAAYAPSSPAQPYSAQAMYRSPYAGQQADGLATYGGAVAYPQGATAAPTDASYGEQSSGRAALIFFDDGSSALSSDDREVLRQIADVQLSEGGVVHVVGHASMRSGSADFAAHQQANQRVSEARANSVARQLVEYGVPEDAIEIVAAGDSQPLYSETMPTGEAGNRRAEVYLSAN